MGVMGILASALAVVLGVSRPAQAQQGREAAPVCPVEVVYSLPHDVRAFTQGLFFHNGRLYETTGMRGRSRLAELDTATGEVLRLKPLAPDLFGEGAVAVDGRILWLTWTSGRAQVLGVDDFGQQGTFSYRGEGWGLTFDGHDLVMSDGSAVLTRRDPGDFSRLGEVVVRDAGRRVDMLNELEYAHGLLYANVWRTPFVVVVAPSDGSVLRRLDLRPLYPPSATPREVANGLAWDEKNRCLLVTGKLWPKMYCIRRAGFPGIP